LFLAVSEALREQAIARGYPAERTRVHYNGVDLERFRPGGEAREPGLILHVGRLVDKKGTRVLIDALARLPGARLVVIGEGPLRGALERRAAGAGVRFLGALPSAEVAAWMRRASALAAPSLTAADGDAEGLPNVVVEAAASGLPVVATRHSGIPEAIDDGISGWLVAEGDAATLADRLAAALAAGPEMGRAARALAEARFDGRRQAERLEAIYDEVAEAQPGR
jgi:glycosyltransferase involved in cell wall biosynthesis